MTEKQWVIAHRGNLYAGVENSMEAIASAEAIGEDVIEIDLRMSRDHTLVVFHDESLYRLSPGKDPRKIRDLTMEEIRSVRIPCEGNILGPFPDHGYPDEGMAFLLQYRTGKKTGSAQILTFEELCRWMSGTRTSFFAEVEFKETGLMESCVSLIQKYGLGKRCILFSGVREQAEEIQQYFRTYGNPDGIRAGANIRYLYPDTRAWIRNMDLYEVGLNGGAFTAEETEELKQKGIRIFSNLLDVPSWWERLREVGAAGFKTNCAADAIRILNQAQ